MSPGWVEMREINRVAMQIDATVYRYAGVTRRESNEGFAFTAE